MMQDLCFGLVQHDFAVVDDVGQVRMILANFGEPGFAGFGLSLPTARLLVGFV